MLKKWICTITAMVLIWTLAVCFVHAADAAASLTVTPGYTLLDVGETVQLFPTVLPVSADRRLVYQSNDTSVATVEQNGLVTAVGKGEAEIKVISEIGRYSDTCRVVVGEEGVQDSVLFSPWNMATNTSLFATDGYDRNTALSGGNYSYASAYLSRWDGPVSESEDPYPYDYSVNTLSPMDRYYERDAAYHVQDIAWLFGKKAWNDNEKIKAAVAKYGSVYTTFYAVSDYWCENRTMFYLPDSFSGTLTNLHAVSIIGWDDDFPAERFSVAPPGNGAFICRNSYGTSSGDQGHFYISYYDKTLATSINMVITGVESAENYDKQYCYDPYGTISSWIPFEEKSFYAANIFPEAGNALVQDEILRAVSIFTVQENVQYELHIAPVYDGLTDLCFDIPVQSGTFQNAGYHTVRLHQPIDLEEGTRYAVVFKLTAPSGYCGICVEYPYTYVDPATGAESPLSTSARAGYDEGYISDTQEEWYEVVDYVPNGNLCIRAFTDVKGENFSLFSETEERVYPSDKIVTSEEAKALGLKLMPEHARTLGIPENVEELSLFSETDNLTDTTGMIFPRKYDMRQENCLPAVRNQGTWATCWAHASCLSAESFMMRRAKRTDWGVPLSTLTYYDMAVLSESAKQVKSISFEKDAVTIGVGETMPLSASVLPQTADRNLVWSSSSDAVTVDGYGNVTGVCAGTAEVICKDETGTVSASCMVTIAEETEITEIILEKEKKSLDIGEVYLPVYHVMPGEAIVGKLNWQSSNEAVCTVNENGKITAVSEGYAEISVRTENGCTDMMEIYVAGDAEAKIYTVEQTDDGVLVKVGNHSGETAQVYTAFYDADGRLTGVSVSSVLDGTDGAVPAAAIPEDSVRVKCMIFEGFRPLCVFSETDVN